MRLVGFLLLLCFIAPATFASSDDIELMNSNLIAKLHLDPTPRNGQMVGAYLVSFRPKEGKSTNKVTILLNPGLQFVKADAGRQRLNARANMVPVQGMDILEVNAVEIDLGKTLSSSKRLSGKDRIDIAIHFRGYLEDISWTGLNGVKETLNPNFTMVRAESFGYPLFAEPNITSIKKALDHKPFHQTASIEYPGSGTAVSNLAVESKAINGSKTSAEFSTKNPARLMAAAIGAYSTHASGNVIVSYLDGNSSGASRVSALFAQEINRLAQQLGTVSGAAINVIELPAGYANNAPSDAVFVGSDFFNAPSLSAAHKARIFGLWKFNKSGREGHWGTGLDSVVTTAIVAPDMMGEGQMLHFSSAQQLFAGNSKLGKTALADYVIEGFAGQSDTVSPLAFSVLHELLDRDQFFALVRGIRAELASGYADMEGVAEYLQKNIKNKKAKKFAKNWFSSGKAGKDMAKAKSFADLVKRYK